MNAFDAAERSGTSIPATFLRVEVTR